MHVVTSFTTAYACTFFSTAVTELLKMEKRVPRNISKPAPLVSVRSSTEQLPWGSTISGPNGKQSFNLPNR